MNAKPKWPHNIRLGAGNYYYRDSNYLECRVLNFVDGPWAYVHTFILEWKELVSSFFLDVIAY